MKNILVIRFGSLGDTVLTTGVLKYLKTMLPEVSISVVTFDSFAGVFKGLDFIDKIYTLPKKTGFKKTMRFAGNLPPFHAVFDLHDNLRSKIIKIFASGKVYTYDKNPLARRLFVKFRLCPSFLKEHTVQKYFKPFSEAFSLPIPETEELRPFLPLSEYAFKHAKTVVIHPFASKKCKQWPYIYELCQVLESAGISVIVIGDGAISLPEKTADMTGLLNLDELKNIISQADLFISTDSGPMHIAVALKIPTIAIFGPTTMELGFYPIFQNTHVIENKSLLCRPCHIHGCDICPQKHFQCMRAISPAEVLSQSMKILKNM